VIQHTPLNWGPLVTQIGCEGAQCPTDIASDFFSPQIAIGSKDGVVRIFSLPDGKLQCNLVPNRHKIIQRVLYQPLNNHKIFLANTHQYNFWDLQTQQPIRDWTVSSCASGIVVSHPMPNLLVSVDEESMLNLYDIKTSKKIVHSLQTSDDLKSVDCKPDGSGISVLGADGTLFEFDLRKPFVPVTTLPDFCERHFSHMLEHQQKPFPPTHTLTSIEPKRCAANFVDPAPTVNPWKKVTHT